MADGRGAGGSARWSGATTRWTATSAGTGSSSPTTCSCTAAPSTGRPPARQAAATPTSATRPTSSSRRCCVGEEARIRSGDSVVGVQLPARPDARDHPRAGRARVHRVRPRRRRAGASATRRMTEYEEGWPYPVAFPPERPAITLPAVIAGRGERQLHVAETEKYPHVTYFFNGGEEAAVRGRAARAGPLAARRPDLRLQAGDERARGRRGVRRAPGRPSSPTFGIINFANADMVGHTGVIQAAVEAIETRRRVPAARSSTPCTSPAALPDHRRPRQRRPHARARRQPEHRPLAQPGAGDRHRAGLHAAVGRGPRRRRADPAGDARDRAARQMTGRSLIES